MPAAAVAPARGARNSGTAPVATTTSTTAPGARERGESPWLGRGIAPSEAFLHYQQLERSLGALMAPVSSAVSPVTAVTAFVDWAMHLALSPAKQWELSHLAGEQVSRWLLSLAQPAGEDGWCIRPLPQDKRFNDPAWRTPPYAWLAQAFLLRQQWWLRATTGVPGVDPHHEAMIEFAARQWLDMVSPSNSVLANPVVLKRTLQTAGANLMLGASHAVDDALREATRQPPAGAEAYRVGDNLALTKGRVVLRNGLIELLQYAPTTTEVHAEPVLIVPAWIMKYYVLDLTPQDSLVKYLVDRGHTVFAISWKNPGPEDRDRGLDDYHRLGVRAALDAVQAIVPGSAVHGVGYCLGGTLLAMAAAALGRERSKVLKTLTLLAAQTDFTDPGEISLFIDESQVAFLEAQMWRKGYLDKDQMRDSFQMLRSRDLVWSYRLATYLLGERAPVSALSAWNADGTRMPFRMHSEYLRSLFLDNALARGKFRLEGKPIHLADIRGPVFSVGAVQDHIAPWRSVFKLHQYTDADHTFLLTAGGHNVGIVNPPGQPRSSYRVRHWRAGEQLLTADEWLEATQPVAGSWWPVWADWVVSQCSGRKLAPPEMGAPAAGLAPLDAAPGLYVHQQ